MSFSFYYSGVSSRLFSETLEEYPFTGASLQNKAKIEKEDIVFSAILSNLKGIYLK